MLQDGVVYLISMENAIFSSQANAKPRSMYYYIIDDGKISGY
jgi:hypothetical protein